MRAFTESMSMIEVWLMNRSFVLVFICPFFPSFTSGYNMRVKCAQCWVVSDLKESGLEAESTRHFRAEAT